VTKPLTGRALVRRSLGSLAAVAALACGKNERTQVDSGGALAAQPTAQARRLPGTLTKPIDQYTGDEFFALTRSLRFTGGNERERRCRGRAECRGANRTASTHIRVDAVDTQDSLSAKTAPQNGVIAVRAINRGLIADTMYNMRPTARFEYYLIVLPGVKGGNASWRLEELDVAQGIRAHRLVATGVFRGCNHPFVRGARADFKSCATGAPIRPASTGAFQGGSEDPIWVGCDSGCCTAGPPDGAT
jgi:hypothetical protein